MVTGLAGRRAVFTLPLPISSSISVSPFPRATIRDTRAVSFLEVVIETVEAVGDSGALAVETRGLTVLTLSIVRIHPESTIPLTCVAIQDI